MTPKNDLALGSMAFEGVDSIEVTKFSLTGQKSFQVASIRGQKVKKILDMVKTASKLNEYACGPSVPKYLMSLYGGKPKKLIGEIRARGSIVQLQDQAGYIQSRDFVNTLEASLKGKSKKQLGAMMSQALAHNQAK